MTSQGQPAWPTLLLTPTLATAGETHPKGGGPEARISLPSLLTQVPVEDWVNQLSRAAGGNAASLSVPWKWFSTERVTAPPWLLPTITSWVRALPSALAPASPHLRTYVRGGLAVSSSESFFFFFFDMPEDASVLLRDGLAEVLALWVKAEWSGHLPSGK